MPMIKDILVNLEPDAAKDRALPYALSVARIFDAHVAGTVFAYDPVFPGYVGAELSPILFEEIRARGLGLAKARLDLFDEAARRDGISSEHRLVEATLVTAPLQFSRAARRFDLSVVMQSEPGGANNDALIETALFGSGRPIVVVPYVQKEPVRLDRVLCCWDASQAAARAINDALPLLAKAASCSLLVVDNDRTKHDRTEIRGVEMGKHLARHGVKVNVEVVPAGDIGIASAILDFAADNSASLLVMGGYGHSRLREIILGGVTRSILSSMTLPVFMSH
jgi:nucleotide-binding universal stress UspA family protein